MRLTVLGCAGSAPGPGKACSGYLLEAEGFLLGMELGNGTLAQLQLKHDPFSLGALMFSHLHPDHCADFSALTVLRRHYAPSTVDTRQTRLPVYASHDASARFARAHAPSETNLPKDFFDVYDFYSLSEEALRIGPFEVLPFRVQHQGLPAFGFRISHGSTTFAYTGDSGPCAALLSLARDVGTLLAEASWPASRKLTGVPNLHLSGLQAGALARQAGVGRLLLTHISPPWDHEPVLAEARTEFPNAEFVEQGAVYEL